MEPVTKIRNFSKSLVSCSAAGSWGEGKAKTYFKNEYFFRRCEEPAMTVGAEGKQADESCITIL